MPPSVKNPTASPSRFSRRQRLAAASCLLALIVGLIIYFWRHANQPFPRSDPNVGKITGVTITGEVTCNGQKMRGGYVIAWQGAPIAYGEVLNGEYSISNAPLGKCILTYSAGPRTTGPSRPPPKDVGGGGGLGGPLAKSGGPPPKDQGPPYEKDTLRKDMGPPKDKKFGPKDKTPTEDQPPKEKEGGKGGKGRAPLPDLAPEERQLVDSAAAKYSDPAGSHSFKVETKKGANTFNLGLLVP
jgi:hypothetical protein